MQNKFPFIPMINMGGTLARDSTITRGLKFFDEVKNESKTQGDTFDA